MACSTINYKAKVKDDDTLRHEIIKLAKQYGRYGYRKITELLRIQGYVINHKKVEKIWTEEGLQLPKRYKNAKDYITRNHQ